MYAGNVMNLFALAVSATVAAALVVFWVFWTLLTAGAVVGFYYIDNRWLE